MKRYLSIKQICDQLPVCKSLVYRMVRDGSLPSTRFGGKILVPEEDLEALLEQPPPEEDPPEEPPAPAPAPPSKPRGGPSGKKINLW